MTRSVVVLGGTGMLGAMVIKLLSDQDYFEVVATRRNNSPASLLPNVRWREFDCIAASVSDCRRVMADAEWVINCIGITKPLIREDDAASIECAIRVNSVFPHVLAAAAKSEGARVIQIATDCVFSGSKGDYAEDDSQDPLDVYGKTKSLGEVTSTAVHHLRASIIGPEPKDHKFLLDWFLGQPRSAKIDGFVNHRWNGVTTLHFARVVLGLMQRPVPLPHVQHLVPGDIVSKGELLEVFARCYRRSDIHIHKVPSKITVDRNLCTLNHQLNEALWSSAGYSKPPTVADMIEELAGSALPLPVLREAAVNA
jgi:dTDP-4-dehydrorhamnose reductase